MAASRMCQGVTKSGSPTPREITSFMPWTMSKKSRMPDRGIERTFSAMNCFASKDMEAILNWKTRRIRKEKFRGSFIVEQQGPGETRQRPPRDSPAGLTGHVSCPACNRRKSECAHESKSERRNL